MQPSDWTLDDLHLHLMGAVELELLTIPPYLTALYSLQPDHNLEASLVIRSVVLEEMLHLTLAANVLNAVGGRPDLTGGYVPRYPAALPFHEPATFQVGLQPFSDACLEVFLAIENPSAKSATPVAATAGAAVPRVLALAREHGYPTIGAFYTAIQEGLRVLDAGPEELFTGDVSRQIRPEHYYAGGGQVIVVTCLQEALAALEEVVEQGEGELTSPRAGEKFDPEGDLAHFYRFDELRQRRRYRSDDVPGAPTGAPVELDLTAVYRMQPNLRAADLSGDLRALAVAFNAVYTRLLNQIQTAVDGRPDELALAVGTMFELKYAAIDLFRTPLPGGRGLYAGPTFEHLP